MSRTYRKSPRNYHRHPGGHRGALVRGDRAVPPDPWDDLCFDNREYEVPRKVVVALLGKGVEDCHILHRLVCRYRFSPGEALELIGYVRKWSRKGVPRASHIGYWMKVEEVRVREAAERLVVAGRVRDVLVGLGPKAMNERRLFDWAQARGVGVNARFLGVSGSWWWEVYDLVQSFFDGHWGYRVFFSSGGDK